MSPARLDVVIFGASGYTGRFVIKELVRISRHQRWLRWGVAGRSQVKLDIAVQSACSPDERKFVRVITADADDESSLRLMCAATKVVINCCGPYYQCGEAVVRAAIDTTTHYLDVCSEPTFLELVWVKYEVAARKAGVLVINACGLGCVPVDLGVLYLEQCFNGTLNSVEAYLVSQPSGETYKRWPANVLKYSTYEAAIYEIANGSKTRQSCSLKFEPELKPRGLLHKRFNRWCKPYPGADEAVVNRTQHYFYKENNKRPVQFKRYHSSPFFLDSILALIGSIILWMICRVFCMSKFLIRHPRLCSLGIVTYGDPDESFMRQLSFEHTLVGVGWKGEPRGQPTDEIIARVYTVGDNAPYEGTAVVVVHCAITILTARDKMPSYGGVFTPGAAFKNTDLIQKLNEDKLKFEII
ncbi:saccharopine dehydrogenase-like oxidoreductase isoform X3 [Leptidea sinapis]|nr:saccharopine dehydrogenase-like oxidoreductase isoform X3 [Leptidea sinapis]XP_050671058.1 saccharopine dehydrogenase-like oxidoreductase isoform X3 [Leptidea sinapis]